jgi:hypothetical protein
LALPQWLSILLLAAVWLFSIPSVVASMHQATIAWDAWMLWAGVSAILIAATMGYTVHGANGTAWDWYEHWLRARIFLNHAAVTSEIGIYNIPARGPLFNAAAAALMWFAGSQHYWVFQIVATVFNSLLVLPALLLLESIGGLSRRNALMLAAGLCAVVPYFFWNNTFTWTKDLTAAFVLMATYSCRQYMLKGRTKGAINSLAWLAPGFLCHYLVVAYAAVLVLYLLYIGRPKLHIQDWLRVATLSALLIGPWFGYLFLNFGIKRTLASNTTVGRYYAAKDESGKLVPYHKVFVANLCTDLLSNSLCRLSLPDSRPSPCITAEPGKVASPSPGSCKPKMSLPQTLFVFLGYSGSLALLLFAIFAARDRSTRPGFGAWFLSAGLLLNLMPIRWFDPNGTFLENLQAWCLVLAAVCVRYLARLPKPAVAALTVFLLCEFLPADFSQIQAHVRRLPFTHSSNSLQGKPPMNLFASPVPVSEGSYQVDELFHRNYEFKIRGGAVYFRDQFPADYPLAIWTLSAAGLFALLAARRLASVRIDCVDTHE